MSGQADGHEGCPLIAYNTELQMEQRFNNNRLDLETLREFCEREGEAVVYRKGDQLEREGDPARWLAFVTEGCFKYVTHGISSSTSIPTPSARFAVTSRFESKL